ncbi:hypothetical protein GCM10022246_10150 [Pedobacter ginsengiterrae]|uniref:Zinc finger CGNR domain-containing protein n=1 Tax=Pedobacter ginsengiterrae TaxID=871696 RepID=A0ABP7P2D8_9SPHI
MNKLSTVKTMTFDGGADCLDFINSGYHAERDIVVEKLHSYDDLLILSERLDLLTSQHLHCLTLKAATNPEEAKAALIKTLEARKLLYNIFAGLAARPQKNTEQLILDQVNALFSDALKYRRLIFENGNLIFSFQPKVDDLMAPLWKFILSAYDLFKTQNLNYIKQCQRCAWLFLDQTKNHRKKWCNMEPCGNIEKTRRYYQNKKRS